MGLYAMSCRQCGKGFFWFSGNLDQRCAACRTPLDAPVFMRKCDRCGKEMYTDQPITATVAYCDSACAD